MRRELNSGPIDSLLRLQQAADNRYLASARGSSRELCAEYLGPTNLIRKVRQHLFES